MGKIKIKTQEAIRINTQVQMAIKINTQFQMETKINIQAQMEIRINRVARINKATQIYKATKIIINTQIQKIFNNNLKTLEVAKINILKWYNLKRVSNNHNIKANKIFPKTRIQIFQTII